MQRRLRFTFVLPGLAIALAVSGAWTDRAALADEFDPVRQRIIPALRGTNLPSIAVAVARDGKIVWEQGFGWADRENRVAASEHTLYSVASVSKPLTATGLMVLVERGLVDLDKPVNEYLGEAKLRARVGNADDATVRRVANHTSGLPLHYQFFYADEAYRPPTREETIRRYGNLVTAPGERYQYSNLGYGILDYVIERASGKNYADFMREEVFLPLGMTHTSIDVAPGLEPHQAIRYTPGGKRIPFYEFDHPGASAAYASAHDLARFAMFHLKEHVAEQRPILRDASIDAMHAATATTDRNTGYGVGWATQANRRGYQCVQHTGSMPGVSTICRFVPSQRLAVVVLSNSRSGLPSRLAEMITNLLLPGEGTDEAPSGGDPDASAGGPFVPSAELAGTWKGRLVTHQSETPLTLAIKESGDIHVRLGSQPWTLLNDAGFEDGFLRGVFGGDVDYDDHRGRKYQLHLELKLRDGVLNGPVMAITLPDQWGSSAVAHWVELKRPAGEP
jgi:CubicO group peptidase (beta-lactamase class C family)